jgi:hypothetical protein
MSTERLNEAIKTRVPRASKRALEQIARERHLDVADIVREALREHLDRAIIRPSSKVKQPA